MGFSLRTITNVTKFSENVRLNVLERAIPQATVEAVVADVDATEERTRKLPAVLTTLLCVAMGLFTDTALEQVLSKLVKGLRYIWPDDTYQTANKSAISQARYRLTAKPVVELYRRVCKPMATQATVGAFLFGLLMVAIDGTTEDVADTPANVAFFGRHHGDRGDSAFPQTQAVYLCECGTHVIFDAGFWPCHTSERVGGLRMLRSVEPGMLVMWDRGFHSFDMAYQTHNVRKAHFLGRLPSSVKPKFFRALSDGSYLAYIHPAEYQRRKRGERLLVRVIEYTIEDPHRTGHRERHRLITSLLDPDRYPAHTLACEYHQRWEAEIAIDEVDTHQRLPKQALRSRKPAGVIQEAYGLLIAHYAVRMLMHEAALQSEWDPDRLSFTNALEIVCDAVAEFQMTATEQLPRLYQRLLDDISRHRLPKRDNRSNPRVIKRKMSNFKLKRPEHVHWPQPARSFSEAIVLLN
jgi:hypothetical protein